MIIKKRNDFALAVVFLLGSAFLYQQTYLIRKVMVFSLGPLVFPRFLLGSIFVLALCMLFQSIDFHAAAGAAPAGAPRTPDQRKATVLRLSLIGLLLAYLLALPYVGYVVSTILFLFLGMMLLGHRTPKQLALYAAIAVALTLSLQYVFGTLLKLFLP